MKEIEAKILEIDRAKVEKKLASVGAILEFDHEFFAIYYDTPDLKLRSEGKVIRLRKEGPQTVLTIKSKIQNNSPIKMMEEHETIVRDFEKMQDILAGLGYVPTLKMRKNRAQYLLSDSHVVIDQYLDDYAYIPVFLEIESPSEERLYEVTLQLGYDSSELSPMNAARLISYYK